MSFDPWIQDQESGVTLLQIGAIQATVTFAGSFDNPTNWILRTNLPNLNLPVFAYTLDEAKRKSLMIVQNYMSVLQSAVDTVVSYSESENETKH